MTIKKELYTVEGMSCNHCKMAVEKEVKALPGMVSAIVDLAAKTLTVEYDGEKTNPAAIKIAVEDAGFTVA
ncbi:MAG TPA: cation transporter [Negativicutes bacterium]|nr:cation transporter [Negativicutes bacterium]